MEVKQCRICGRAYNQDFYDKGTCGRNRYLCSRACYAKYIDSLPKRDQTKLHDNKFKDKEPKYEYYMRGKLSLVNFKL